MAEMAVRVALLARPGNARDQLHRALTDLGAVLVAEGDPAELDPATVTGQSPNLVLISLEPAIEAALDRFDTLLAKPGVEVMYDDAETTRQLDGWDLNRWARHLAAKLLGTELLPPVPDGAAVVSANDMTPQPGAVPTPADEMAHARLEDYTRDTHGLADIVPTNPSLTAVAVETVESPAEPPVDQDATGMDFDFDIKDIEAAMQSPVEETHLQPVESAPEPEEPSLELDQDFEIDFDLSSLEAGSSETAASSSNMLQDDDAAALSDIDFGSDSGGHSGNADAKAADLLQEDDATPLLADIDFDAAEPVRFSNFSDEAQAPSGDGLDSDVAALAAQMEAFEKTDHRQAASQPDFSSGMSEVDIKDKKPAPSASNLPPPKSAADRRSNLSLTEMHEPIAAAKPAPQYEESSGLDTSHLSLQALEPGLVLIVAGMGGPDAVRQMLSTLPESLPVPVLLYQHLEVGKHERLVEQLAKISRLPVTLAKDGTKPKAGEISVLPAGMSAQPDDEWTVRFCPGPLAQLISALPAKDSVIVLLSGADASLVSAVRAVEQAGGLTLAQDPEGCFDPAAAVALKKAGSMTFPALGLARQVAARWSL